MAEILLKGRYRNLAELGRGERTVTYRAEDTALNRVVAVKILRQRYATDEDFVDRFRRAAQAIAGLSHPGIVAVYDVGTDRDLHYLVTEYVEGGSLESLLATGIPLDVDQALDIAMQVCAALGAVHRAGFVHSQLTPRNILLTKNQQVKLSDFGVFDTPIPTSLAEISSPREAALHLSPEQAMGRRPVPSSDVYTMGTILYKMLAGRPPFDGETFTVIADQHIRAEPEPLDTANPEVPRPLSALVRRALAKTSGDRYRTGTVFQEALMEYRRQSSRRQVAVGIETRNRSGAPERVRREEVRRRRSRVSREEAPAPIYADKPGPDWIGVILGMIAFVAVLGLVPLWVAVFLRYFA